MRGRRVYLVQSTVFPTNDNFMELLFWLDAFKRASAESVTAIVPYFSYAKGDKKDEPRVSVRGGPALEVVGAGDASLVPGRGDFLDAVAAAEPMDIGEIAGDGACLRES